MTTYLEKFQADFEAATESYVADVANIQSQYDKAQQRLVDERDRKSRAEKQIEKLTSAGGEKVSADRDSYERFKGSVKKLRAEVQTSDDAIAMLQGQVLPKLAADLAAAKSALEKAAGELFRILRDRFEQRLQELFGGLLTEADDYFGSCRKLAESAGVRYLPRSLAGEIEIDKYRLKVGEDRLQLQLLPHSSWPKKET